MEWRANSRVCVPTKGLKKDGIVSSMPVKYLQNPIHWINLQNRIRTVCVLYKKYEVVFFVAKDCLFVVVVTENKIPTKGTTPVRKRHSRRKSRGSVW